jgi:hypothetical protein
MAQLHSAKFNKKFHKWILWKGKESGQLYISYAIRTDCMQKHPQNKQNVLRFRFP